MKEKHDAETIKDAFFAKLATLRAGVEWPGGTPLLPETRTQIVREAALSTIAEALTLCDDRNEESVREARSALLEPLPFPQQK